MNITAFVRNSWFSLFLFTVLSFDLDVCRSHLLVSVLLWVLRVGHGGSVVSDLLQPDVLCIPSAHHWHPWQRCVSRNPSGATSALHEWAKLGGTFIYLHFCYPKQYASKRFDFLGAQTDQMYRLIMLFCIFISMRVPLWIKPMTLKLLLRAGWIRFLTQR